MNEECWPLINMEYVLVLGSPRECGLILTLEMYQAQIMIKKKKRGGNPCAPQKIVLLVDPLSANHHVTRHQLLAT